MTEILVTSSVLILALTALRYLLRGKISLRLQYALWLLVALRLLLPLSGPQSALSVLNAVEPVSAALEYQEAASPARPAQTPAGAPVEGAVVPAGNQGIPSRPASEGDQEAPPAPQAFPWQALLRGVWLTGAAAVAVWLLAVNLLFRRKLRRSARRLDLPGCPLPVYVTPAAPSPCLCGILRPAIYLTPACLADQGRLRHILAHEYTHYRHRDPIWALVRCLCLALYWFDPLVWLAAALSRRDCELACDEGALRTLGETERKAYGQTLLAMITPTAGPAELLRTATTMSSGKRGLRERIVLIARRPRMMAATLVCVLLLAALAVGCTFTAARPQESDQADLPLDSRIIQPPQSLLDKGIVMTQDQSQYFNEGLLASFYYQPDYDGQGMGWICDIVRLTPVEFEQEFVPYWFSGGVTCLGRDEDYYYVYAFPTDVRFDPAHAEEAQSARQALDGWLDELLSTQSGLTPLEEDPVYQGLMGECFWPGRHINVQFYPYYGLSGYGEMEDTVYTLVLSQPVRQGEGGIWCVDRWYDGNGNAYYAIPQLEVTMAEHYAALQEACDRGDRPDLLSPREVALAFEEEDSGRDLSLDAFVAGAVYEGPVRVGEEQSGQETLTGPVAELWTDPEAGTARLTLSQDGVEHTVSVPVSQGNGLSSLVYPSQDVAWTRLDTAPSPAPGGGWNVTLAAEGTDRWLRFWQDSPYVLCSLDGVQTWYETRSLQVDPWGLSGIMRRWYDEAEYTANLAQYAYADGTGLEADRVALAFAQGLGEALEHNSSGGMYAVAKAAPYQVEVRDIDPSGSRAMICWITMALDMDPEISVGFNPGAGVSPIEEGEYTGWWSWSSEVALCQEDGIWRPVEWGSGGMSLEPYL